MVLEKYCTWSYLYYRHSFGRFSRRRRLPELPRVATSFLPNRIHNVLPDSEQLFAVLAPPSRKMAVVSKVLACCCGKVPGATKNSQSAINHTMESLQAEESNDMQKCILLYKMATRSRTLTFTDTLVLFDQQKELEDALTTGLDAHEDTLKTTVMKHRHRHNESCRPAVVFRSVAQAFNYLQPSPED